MVGISSDFLSVSRTRFRNTEFSDYSSIAPRRSCDTQRDVGPIGDNVEGNIPHGEGSGKEVS